MARWAHQALACLGLAMLAAAVPAAGAASRKLLQSLEITVSGTALVLEQDLAGKTRSRVLAVLKPSGETFEVQLDDARHFEGIRSGTAVQVTGHWSSARPATNRSSMDGFEMASPPGSVFKAILVTPAPDQGLPPPGVGPVRPRLTRQVGGVVAAGAGKGGKSLASAVSLSSNAPVVASLNTLFIPINAVRSPGVQCPGVGKQPLLKPALEKVIFQELNPQGHTVGSTFNRCSFNRTRLTRQNSLVANPVNLPCSGATNGKFWSFSSCEFQDFNGFADAANAVLKARGVDLSKYFYKVYLLPPGGGCSEMVGQGYVGCTGDFECRSWVGGNYWSEPMAYAHELGHNLFMAHSGQVDRDGMYDEYGDESCTQGYCCLDSCWNTPHAWQQGWITVQQFDGASLTPGQTVAASVAGQASSTRSGIRIVPNWAAGADPIFLGYRIKAGEDDSLLPQYAQKVNIHTANITHAYDAKQTSWKGALARPGDSWQDPASGIVVRLSSYQQGSALVTICRRKGAETAASCAAGNDNDCDGRAGGADPACLKFKRRLSAQATPPTKQTRPSTKQARPSTKQAKQSPRPKAVKPLPKS